MNFLADTVLFPVLLCAKTPFLSIICSFQDYGNFLHLRLHLSQHIATRGWPSPPCLGRERSSVGLRSLILPYMCLHIAPAQRDAVTSVVKMMHRTHQVLADNENIDEKQLAVVLKDLGDSGGAVALNLSCQNAGVIITKQDESVYIEAFELCPKNQTVMESPGRLRRRFPDVAAAIPLNKFDDVGFRANLVHVLSTLCQQAAPGTRPRVMKANQSHEENRDTVDPMWATEWLLTGVLATDAKPIDRPGICKKVRDRVLWNDSFMPWRRSPAWLLARVAIQIDFSRESAGGHELYKHFMLFMTASILDNIPAINLSSDMMYTMWAKVAQRKRKLVQLCTHTDDGVLRYVDSCMDGAKAELARRQNLLSHDPAPALHIAQLESLDFSSDTSHRLPDFESFLESIKDRKQTLREASFNQSDCPGEFNSGSLPSLYTNATDYTAFTLAAFEEWVAKYLDEWLVAHIADQYTCRDLASLMSSYDHLASPEYTKNPEGASVLVLTALELWIACDKSATHLCPLLKEYKPHVPAQLLQSLLLPFREQMKRLRKAELYLEQRSLAASPSLPNIFQRFATPESFAVRYYSRSRELQELYRSIADDATRTRKEKIAELSRLQDRYITLKSLSDSLSCTQVQVWHRWSGFVWEHDGCCKKCALQTAMNCIKIDIHEWPLPSQFLAAQAAVFELGGPAYFSFWRDATAFLVLNVLQCRYSANNRQMECRLSGYQALSGYGAAQLHSRRIALSSSTKPHVVTHRSSKHVAGLTGSDVCLNNGMTYAYYDNVSSTYVHDFQAVEDSPRRCMYSLPTESQWLEKYLFRPSYMPQGQPPNLAIANQHEVPDSFSLPEFRALASIPLGHKIQWLNILSELASSSVDFRKDQTSLVLFQAMYQTGPPADGSALREGHQVLDDVDFCHKLVAQLHGAAGRIKQNWESSQALANFIFIATRILTLSSAEDVHKACLKFLTEARRIAASWLKQVHTKAQAVTEEVFRLELLGKTAELALICVATFDVDDEPHLHFLLSNAKNTSVLIQCCISIQESLLPDVIKARGTILALMIMRWKRVCHRASAYLSRALTSADCQGIVKDNKMAQDSGDQTGNGLDDAILQSWSDYRKGGHWRRHSMSLQHWLVTETTPINGRSLDVKYNLLTGELLVNNLPLSRLPAEYERHTIFQHLFGNTILDVMPSSIPGMQFSVKAIVSGYTVNLGHQDSGDLIMSATHRGTGVTFQIIPARLFKRHLPSSLVHDCTHWYNTARNSVEFRPIRSSWQHPPAEDIWTLIRVEDGVWRLQKGPRHLVSRHSRTEKAIAAVLNPIEDVQHLHVCLDTSTAPSRLDVEVPRLRLQFSLEPKSNKLESHQYRGMWIDSDSQSIGTLIGLTSKVVLVSSGGARLLLVPDGKVQWGRTTKFTEDPEGSMHVSVTVAKGTCSGVRTYRIDTQLGRLVDDGSFRDQIYLAFLFAITSFPHPDPLTAHTGTEQALMILQSGAVRSLSQLGDENLALLVQISQLTPLRAFYPAYLKEMEQVEWQQNLGFLSQHSQFFISVKALLQQADRHQKLYSPGSSLSFVDSLPRLEESLIEYDLVNSAWCRTSGFGAENFTTTFDRTYQGRGLNWDVARANACFATSKVILSGHPRLSANVEPHSLQWRLWRCFLPAGTIEGPKKPVPSSYPLAFDFSWLHDNTTVLNHICHIQNLLGKRAFACRHKVMSWMSAMVFAANSARVSASHGPLFDPLILRVLEAFVLAPAMAQIAPPDFDSFNVAAGYQFLASDIKKILESDAYEFWECPESRLAQFESEDAEEFNKRRTKAFQRKMDALVAGFISSLEGQWPCASPTAPSAYEYLTYFPVHRIMPQVRDKFTIWYRNHCFYEYLGKIAGVMKLQEVATPVEAPKPPPACLDNHRRSFKGFVSVDDIFGSHECPDISPLGNRPVLLLPETAAATRRVHGTSPPRVRLLGRMLEFKAKSDFERRYIKDLDHSIEALQQISERAPLSSEDLETVKQEMQTYFAKCRRYLEDLHAALEFATIGIYGADGQHTAPLPRICPAFFLSQLAAYRWKAIPESWKPVLIRFALAHHDIQRAERLIASSRNANDLAKELANLGHINWKPEELPSALLMEVESNITIRAMQIDIASTMISPPNGRNSVMQLNMGEGKSSVIVPIVASALADGSRLVRVVVGKAQAPQMRQMLLSKLGGLLNIKVYQLPFSRALRLDSTQVSYIAKDLQACQAEGGILLVQPEHLLSFKLMGLESLISGKTSVGEALLQTQRLLDCTSRDIVDESDENFSVKFELVYTMGAQRPLEFSPDRWRLLLNVLTVVKDLAPSLAQEMPHSIEINDIHGLGSFSRLRIFGHEAQDRLTRAVAERICKTGLPGLSIARQGPKSRAALFTYLTKPDLSFEEISAVEDAGVGGFWSESTKRPLLQLRGLLAGGILGFAFSQKRWRVNYGFDPNRNPPTRLAVPYRAKDQPSSRSEFSHPEIVQLLTALSLYYGGLSDEDLFVAFTYLLKSDQPEQEYDAWVKDASALPSTFHHLQGVNITDRVQCTEHIFPALRYAKGAVDFFLSRVVYPKYLKEFPSKLSASGWDLGDVKVHPTTGFSGTNDSRELLPLSVSHLDLPEQKHTNALVLEYLLRDENDVISIPSRGTSSSDTDAEQLLNLVVGMPKEVQVILDVGAQILELSNFEVAYKWLKMRGHGKKACVYFEDDDEMWVVDLNGHKEPLLTSPFARQLDMCLIFLDEAHTRGTDLKLPDHYRAALTLGANLTKDRLVQAAMRMRKLGKGQSVTFCVPQEIRTKIMQRANKQDVAMGVIEVLEWAISETFTDIQQSIPLWAVQGRRFGHQKYLYDQKDNGEITEALASKFLEDEAQTIHDLYCPGKQPPKACCGNVDRHNGADDIVAHCSKFGAVRFNSAALHEEQERELSPEVEKERQIEKPEPAKPACHKIYPAVRRFVRTGDFTKISMGDLPAAFQTLANTSAAGNTVRLDQFPWQLRVTKDFAKTIEAPDGSASGLPNQYDQYQRTVRFILTSTGGDLSNVVRRIVIISPYEAQELLAEIEKYGKVTLHIYGPRSTMSFAPLDHLLLHARPAPPRDWSCPLWLTAQLNVFAGQLYIKSFDEYKVICDMLGLYWKVSDADGVLVHADGFIDPSSRGALNGDGWATCTFTQSPVPFIKVLMTKIRRDCETIAETHMGKIPNGEVLLEEQFESSTPV
ncbi:hypothetical protein RB601_009770 [Gaeumannomyces tritici]